MAEATTVMDPAANGQSDDVATGVATVPTSGPMAVVYRLTGGQSLRQVLPAAIGIVVAIIGMVFFVVSQQPERTTLYASLPDSEKARVVDALKNAGVDVALDPTTGDVIVPVRDYHSSRMTLAAQGLPASIPDGYDSLSDLPMGSSRSVENVRLKQTQEIELARSISEIEGLVTARVHLAIPEKSVFARASTPPTASVFAQMENGRSLSRQQVDAIVHLVSSSVPFMAKNDVTVVDQYGNLLSRPPQDSAGMVSDAQLEHRIRLEDIYRNRVIALVSPIVGAGNVTAQVNLNIDFTRSEVTEEVMDPEGTALRSEQRSSETSSEIIARGVPGATSNRAPAQTDINTQQNPDSSDPNAAKARSSSETRNYEVSRTVSTTQRPSSQITGIQAAVLVREMEVVDPETGLSQIQEIPQEKLDEIEALVANTIGIDKERGDSLTVSSSTFVSALEGIKKPWYDMDWAVTIMRQGLTILIMAVVVLGVIRPLINRIMVPAATGGPGEAVVAMDEDVDLDTVEIQEGESLEDIKAKLKPKKAAISPEMLDTANTYDDKVAVIRMIVSDEAGRVSNVFKSMMRGDLDSA
ncbi:MAG: flagellar M-ring protein FliF [Alphaproteobacteria bacterium]|nr:flagellar M-ring protein FliF [Alphaproteobacteria bacterium]